MEIRNTNSSATCALGTGIEIRDKSKIQITKYYKLTTNYCFATGLSLRRQGDHRELPTISPRRQQDTNIFDRIYAEVLYKHINSAVLQAAEKLS